MYSKFLMTIFLKAVMLVTISTNTKGNKVVSINNQQPTNVKGNETIQSNETHRWNSNEKDIYRTDKESTNYEQPTTPSVLKIPLSNFSKWQISANESGNMEPNKSTPYYFRDVSKPSRQISSLGGNKKTKTTDNKTTMATKSHTEPISVNTANATLSTMIIRTQNVTDDPFILIYSTT